MWLTKQLSSIATVATMALGVLLVSPLTPARASAKRMNWIPSGDYNPSVGDLWSFTCPKGGTFSLFVDTLKDNPDGTSSIDPYFEVVDGKGDLVQFRDTDFECTAPPRCGVDGWCPGAWDVPCGRGATHTIAIGSTPGGGLACSGGGGYEIRLEVRTKTGKLLKDTQTKLGGGAVRKLPKWAAGVGKNGPILEDQVVPTLTFPFDACSPTLSVERELFSLPPASKNPSVELGPFSVGEGTLDGNLSFPPGYIMCACVGPESACIPFCGPGPTVPISIEVPSVYPAGDFFAQVYYNINFGQPAEGASGEVRLTFTRHCP